MNRRYITQNITSLSRRRTIYYTQLNQEEPSAIEVLRDFNTKLKEEEKSDEEKEILF